MHARITSFEDLLDLQQQERDGAAQTAAEHLMFEAEPAEEVVFAAEVEAAPAEPMEMETEEAAAGETPNVKGATAKDTPVEEAAPDEGEEGPLEEPARDSASPDEMLKAATAHDEAGPSAGLVD